MDFEQEEKEERGDCDGSIVEQRKFQALRCDRWELPLELFKAKDSDC